MVCLLSVESFGQESPQSIGAGRSQPRLLFAEALGVLVQPLHQIRREPKGDNFPSRSFSHDWKIISRIT